MAAKVVMKAVRTWKRRFCYVDVSEVVYYEEQGSVVGTHNRDTECHSVKRNRRDCHDDEDDPKGRVSSICEHVMVAETRLILDIPVILP